MTVRDKILLIDDDANALTILQRYLTKYGFKTIIANSAPLGLKKFSNEKDEIGLVVTDLQMPMISGQAVIEKLGSDDPDMPIIVFSGVDTEIANLPNYPNVKEIVSKPINYNHFHIVAKTHFRKE